MEKNKNEAIRGIGKSRRKRKESKYSEEVWAAAEADYRAGLLSQAEMAKKHGVGQSAISMMAQRRNWERGDLTPDIAKTAETILAREAAKDGRSDDLNAVIGDNAQIVANVMRDHRLLSKKARELGVKFLHELEANADGDNLNVRAAIYQKLSGSLKTIVEVERLAFGIDKNSTNFQIELPKIEVSFVASDGAGK